MRFIFLFLIFIIFLINLFFIAKYYGDLFSLCGFPVPRTLGEKNCFSYPCP
ncbi:unnamed protein product [Nyctereutes procyonoides]|uniref:(raccoon dog) hypothetical protein n=1 Tax=Nyctereutes procyonoides TaxID=34880 RepID=A0A811YU60_NYCPR|nr:unnamed protein product [Nyctereutes procyonoides]